MNKTTNLFVFITGAAIGSFSTWLLVKKYYERIADAEIEEMAEYYSHRSSYSDPMDDVDEEAHDETVNGLHKKPDIMEYARNVRERGYVDYSGGAKPETEPKEVADVERPYVISPDEFGELDYRIISLTYYADKVLTDEVGNVIEDVDDTVGVASLETFGEYEEDSVFVRDDRRKIDYEILAEPRKFVDVFETNPHLVEDE